jgi:glycosyltransferase involved in cell wall biosynthesis
MGRQYRAGVSIMSLSEPLVTVAVLSYNTDRFLPALCRSLQAQSHRNFEVLVFDDGSTDYSNDVVKPFLADERFRLIAWKPNVGPCRGVAMALECIRGEFHTLICADDELKPDFLKQRVAWMQEHPQVGLIHGAVEFIDEDGQPLQESSPLAHVIARMSQIQQAALERLPPVMAPADALCLLLQHNLVYSPSNFLRTSTTRRLTPHIHFKWGFASDWFLWLLHAAAREVAYDPTPLARYRIHGTSMSYAPRFNAPKQAEARLIPLCALSFAAGMSFDAAQLWMRYRKPLYALWLRRALVLHRAGLLRDAWLQMAALAYYGHGRNRVSLGRELVRHAVDIVWFGSKESLARRRQWMPVSGLAQINHPFFAGNNQAEQEDGG